MVLKLERRWAACPPRRQLTRQHPRQDLRNLARLCANHHLKCRFELLNPAHESRPPQSQSEQSMCLACLRGCMPHALGQKFHCKDFATCGSQVPIQAPATMHV